MRQLNIWFFSAHDQPRGFSSRTYDFAIELVKRGHQVTMFTNSYCHWRHTDFLEPHERWRVVTIDGIRVVWLKTIPYQQNGWRRGANMLSNAWRSVQSARQLSDTPDVVLGPSVPPGSGWVASYIARKRKAAFVFEVRDVWPIRLVYDGDLSKKSLVYLVFRGLEKYLYRRADLISTVIPCIHDHVSQSGASPQKIRWIPNGVNFQRFTGFVAPFVEKQKLVAMYIGSLGSKHDIPTILRTAYLLKQNNNTTYRFTIVGNGPFRSEYERMAVNLGLINVEFLDAVPKSEVPRMQMGADIFLAPVLNSDAYKFGINFNKLFDYFSSAKPVILACNAPNNPVLEANAGFSIPPEDPAAMARALESFEKMPVTERAAMGERARFYVEKQYDIQKLAAEMESLFIEAIKVKGVMNAART
jgi:glycosyltransferase involved in cell wall biosynthesis